MSSGPDRLSDESLNTVSRLYSDRSDAAEDKFEDVVGLASLSEVNRERIFKKAERYGAEPRDLVDTAIESWLDLSDMVEDGGKIFVLGRDGRMHPLNSEDSSPPAA